MKTKPSPGSWQTDNTGPEPEGADILDGRGRFIGHMETWPDAHLTAAAPDMRRELDALLLWMNEAPGCPDCGQEDGDHYEGCRAVRIERVLNAAGGVPDKPVPTAKDGAR